ncbi:MAG: hypothetical protein JWN48_3793 [Myxococcaceae bacterium]|nr:hypothetical protein [Myxococcaceae bacterium]
MNGSIFAWLEPLHAALSQGLPPKLVWGLVPRIVGALYVVAFASLSPQVLGLIGSRGISPVQAQLAETRRHFPGPLRFVRFPTLLWLNASDPVLRALPWLGMVAGAYAAVGGPGAWWALFACWAFYLSLDACALMFPWDCLLVEAGFLSLFLPELPRLPALEAAVLPLPIISFMWRLLLIRLMWGFAKLKFIRTRPGDSLYLRGFLAWMPICTPLGFRLQHAPAWLLRLNYGFMWFVEVVCPLLAFFRGTPRTIAAAGLASLMAGIWATGNWGFFNLAYGVLCIVLLDTQSSLFDTSVALMTSSPSALLVHLLMYLLMFGALLYFPLNSWATHTFIHWPFEDLTWKRPVLRAIIGFYRALSPFRLLHAYGVFPPNSSPPIKVVPVFEGSGDGEHYQAYGYRYMPTTPESRCPIVAPHHPRIDHLSVYAGSGMSESDYLASLVGAGKPYGFSPFSHASWLHRTAQRLLDNEPSVLRLFGDNPFAASPPRFVRVSLRALSPTSLDEQRRHGRRWRVRHLGVAFAAQQKRAVPAAEWLPPPELMHPDFVHYRKKSPALQAMVAMHRSGVSHQQAVCVASDLTLAEVAAFWSEFVPEVGRDRADFASVDAAAARVYARFGRAGVQRNERIAERYAYLLRLSLEPYFYGELTPKIDKRSNFRFHLLLHELILDGLEAYAAVLREPGLAAARAAVQTDASALYFIAVIRNETIRYHGRALRIARRMTNVAEPFIPGILEFKELLTEAVPPDEAWLPDCTRQENGVWTCEGFVEPDPTA